MQFMNQGRQGVLAAPDCGTTGLGTCVGLAVNMGDLQWTIAHIDSDSAVRRNGDACYQAVTNWVVQQLQALNLPATAQVFVVYTSLGDFSTRAIVDGIDEYFTNTTALVGSDGFYINAAGTAVPYVGSLGNNNNGDGPFSVPLLPACQYQ